jgi:hypothetical protein
MMREESNLPNKGGNSRVVLFFVFLSRKGSSRILDSKQRGLGYLLQFQDGIWFHTHEKEKKKKKEKLRSG